MSLGLIERYRDRLPVTASTPVVTLGEGSTPLLEAPQVSQRAGCTVYLKYEGANPTGSFKDRGMTLAVSKALEAGATEAVCASTGNTSASAAAYCARAGIRLVVVLPEGAIARGKLAQAQIAGARVIAVQGDFDDALGLVRELVERRDIALLNSVNPFRLQGQKTAAFEVVEQLGRAPDWLALPVGNGGNITAYWMGFGEIGTAPRMLAGQAEGAAPLVAGRPRRLRPRSASVTRPVSTRRWRRCSSRAEGSARCPTTRSWPPTGCSRRRRACSASRRRRHPWPRCSRQPRTGSWSRDRRSYACSPGTG